MRLLLDLAHNIRYWDNASRFALAIAVLLMFIIIGVLVAVPLENPTPFYIGSLGLSIAIQAIIMWGNRFMVTPHTLAQRAMMRGEFSEARDTLLEWQQQFDAQNKTMPFETRTLLANAYRNLGDTSQSISLLHKLAEYYPDSFFVLYSLGRAYLADGQFENAHESLQKAHNINPTPDVQFDLAHVYYRLQDHSSASDLLQQATLQEPYRQLMAWHILTMADQSPTSPLSESAYEQAIAFWQAEQNRFAHTAYGDAIQHDLIILQNQ